MNDSQIIDLYFQRDEAAIDETAKKYGAYLETIAYNILKDSFESQECLDDTYMRAWTSIPPTLPRVFSAFLAKITRNIALDKYRRHTADKRSGQNLSLDELSECIGCGDISEDIDISELGALISRFLRSENLRSRQIFIRRYFFEDPIDRIAENMRISQSSVKTSLHRSRKRLAKFLTEEGVYI